MTTVIGISGSVLSDPIFSPVIIKRSFVNEQYIDVISAQGGVPFIIPVTDKASVKTYVSLIDGLILSGGHDVSPHMYGEEILKHTGETFPARDEFEKALLLETLNQNKPILAICRGAQLLNVVHGGTLYQDTSYKPNVKLQHLQSTSGELPVHNVTLKTGSLISSIFDQKEIGVNSFHHQLIKDVASPLESSGKTSDGVIEVIESIDKEKFILGVQWHPEQMAHVNSDMCHLFKAFISAAKK